MCKPMASILRLKDKKFFVDSLRAFSNKRHATFEISNECINISSVDAPYIYLSIENSLFSIDISVSFTIRIDELFKNINCIDSCLVVLEESFKLITFKGSENIKNDCHIDDISPFFNLENNFSYVEIPFINPINSHYIHRDKFPTRILIAKESIKNFMTGLVRYDVTDHKLIVSKQTSEHEEVMEINGDTIEVGHLDFYCRNDWVESILEVYDMISTVLFCFADGLLSVKCLFKDKKSSYLEIQVLEVKDA